MFISNIKKFISKIFDTLANCILPNMPILVGVGMLKVVLIFVGPTILGILSEDSNTYIVLSFIAEAGYYFMPIFVAISSAKIFNTNVPVSGLIGAMLISPTFVSLVEQGKELSIYNIPIINTTYGNQILPSIILVYIVSLIYNNLEKVIPEKIRSISVPLITIVIMAPIAFCLVAPIGVVIGDYLVKLILLLKGIGPMGNAIMCALIPFVTIGGLGGANLSAMLLLAATGCDEILFYSNVLYNNILGFAVLAVYLHDKDSNTLACAITSALGGTSEPAIFGYVIKDINVLLSLLVGDFVAGFISGLLGVKSYAMASFGTFGILTTIGPNSSIVDAAIAMAVGCIISFTLSYFLHHKKANA